jgi:hypothetical protein
MPFLSHETNQSSKGEMGPGVGAERDLRNDIKGTDGTVTAYSYSRVTISQSDHNIWQ